MTVANNTRFIQDIPALLNRYKNLRVVQQQGKSLPILKGVIDIPDDNGTAVGNFLIELHCTPMYPKRFPKLFEVGGEIENTANWHKYPDGSCCITVEPDEIIKCYNDISLLEFMNKYGVPYFLNQIHKKQFGYYLNGEYSHGESAFSEFYSDLLGGSLKKDWVIWALMAFESFPMPELNDACACGSRNKFKDCHFPRIQALRKLGKSYFIFSTANFK